MKAKSVLLLLCFVVGMAANFTEGNEAPQYPDGTIVFSYSKSIIGRIARRMTGGDHYTHVGIVFDGMVYESDWPRSKRTPIREYGKRGGTYDFFIPADPYSADEIARMKAKAIAELDKPYQLRNYLKPHTKKTRGTWCSPYTASVLNASGRWQITAKEAYEPQNLYKVVGPSYYYHSSIKR